MVKSSVADPDMCKMWIWIRPMRKKIQSKLIEIIVEWGGSGFYIYKIHFSLDVYITLLRQTRLYKCNIFMYDFLKSLVKYNEEICMMILNYEILGGGFYYVNVVGWVCRWGRFVVGVGLSLG